MKMWLVALTAIVAAVAAGTGYYAATARADARLQDCGDWVDETNQRVQVARTLLYPSDRSEAFEGSPLQAAEELVALFDEQANSSPPEGAGQLNDDLLEAMSDGAIGLEGQGAAAPETLIVFAKAIIYTADARLLAVSTTLC